MPNPAQLKASATMAQTVSALTTVTLAMKINMLKSSHSPDKVQQLQTEAIVELYDVVRQIQQSLSGLPPMPDVQAVREAAARNGMTQSAIMTSANKRL